jgi:hypothetical protein
LSPAASPLLQIPVGIVVARSEAQSPWVDFVWRPVAVLPEEPDTPPWTRLGEENGTATFYIGGAVIELYRSETEHYRDNLLADPPGLWVVLSPSDGDRPYEIATVTADPAEGEGFTESASYLIEQVPMPETIRIAVAQFVAEHHVDRQFVKRQRKRADPEAMAGRGKHDDHKHDDH